MTFSFGFHWVSIMYLGDPYPLGGGVGAGCYSRRIPIGGGRLGGPWGLGAGSYIYIYIYIYSIHTQVMDKECISCGASTRKP